MQRGGFFILSLRSLTFQLTTTCLRCQSSAFCIHQPSRFASLLPQSTNCKKRRLNRHSALGPLFYNKQRSMSIHMADQSEGKHSFHYAKLVDVDCNLWHQDLKSLLPDTNGKAISDPFRVLDEDDLSHCAAVLSPSSTLAEATRGLELLNARQHEEKDHGQAETAGPHVRILTTVGIHPYHVKDDECVSLDCALESMHELLRNPLHKAFISAVGECGLDASPGFPAISDQLPYFEAQVQLAIEYNLPLFVHERLAFEKCLRILPDPQDAASDKVPVIIHCFTGNREECVEYVRRGYFISVSGYIFKDEQLQKILEDGIIPLERLMVETDAPYMGFPGCRCRYLAKQSVAVEALNSKQRKRLTNSLYPNVPSSLPMVFEKVLEHINAGRVQRKESPISSIELSRITTANANRFFGFGLEEL